MKDGSFNLLSEKPKKPEWKESGVVTTARIKRMLDVQFISELCAVVINGRIIGFDQDGLDDLYAEYEDISELDGFIEDDFVTHVERLKKNVADMMELRPSVADYIRTQGNFYSLWSYLFLDWSGCRPISGLVDRYDEFMRTVQIAKDAQDAKEDQDDVVRGDSAFWAAAIDYANNTRGASTDLTPRTKRHDALRSVMQP